MLNPSWVAVGEALELMCDRGSCVELSWDEEARMWEVMWVTSGKRFVAHDASPLRAATEVLNQAAAYAEKSGNGTTSVANRVKVEEPPH